MKGCGFGKLSVDEYYGHVLKTYEDLPDEEKERLRYSEAPFARTVRKALRHVSGLKAARAGGEGAQEK